MKEVHCILDGLTRKFQFRFKARMSAGNIIGEALKDTIKLADYVDYLSLASGLPRLSRETFGQSIS